MKLRLPALIISEFVNIIFPILIIIMIIPTYGLHFYGRFALAVAIGTFLSNLIIFGFQNLAVVNLRKKLFAPNILFLTIFIYRILMFSILFLIVSIISMDSQFLMIIGLVEVFSIKWYLFSRSQFLRYFIISLLQKFFAFVLVFSVNINNNIDYLILIVYGPQILVNAVAFIMLKQEIKKQCSDVNLTVANFIDILLEGFKFFLARLNVIFSDRLLVFLLGITGEVKIIAVCDLVQKSVSGFMAQNNIFNQYLFPKISEKKLFLSNTFFFFFSFILLLLVFFEIETIIFLSKLWTVEHALFDILQQQKYLILILVLVTSLSHNFGNLVSLLKTSSKRFFVLATRSSVLYVSISSIFYFSQNLSLFILIIYPTILFVLRFRDTLIK